MTFSHSDPEIQFEAVMRVENRHFSKLPDPAWTAIGVNWLAGFHLEIKVIARISDHE